MGQDRRVEHGSERRSWWLAGVLFVVLFVALLFAGGEARDLAIAGLEVVPFVVLALLAYAATRHGWARPLAWVMTVLITGAFVLVSISQAFEAVRPESGPLSDVARREIAVTSVGVAAGLVLGWLCCLRRVRAMLARLMPIDPDSFVHAVALVTIVSLTLMLFVPLTVIGEPPLLAAIERGGLSGLEGDSRDDLYGLFWLLPAALIAVGYPTVRGWRTALTRLGLVWPTHGQVIVALVAGAVMVLIFTGVDIAIGWLWDLFGWPPTDTESFEELMAYSLTPLGAGVIGVTAGLGEEVAVRGVLQPRLGILLSNLFFTALHALQYNFDALLSVFLAGLVLGWVRRRTSTSISAVVHGFYDFLLIMLTVLSVRGFS